MYHKRNDIGIEHALEEVRCYQQKINEQLERLSIGAEQRPLGTAAACETDARLAESIQSILRARDARKILFDEDLFADPAWDMLLELFLADLLQQKLSVSAACIAARVPPTTGLRWLTLLERRGLVKRVPDSLDGRRIYVLLSEKGVGAMRRLVASVNIRIV